MHILVMAFYYGDQILTPITLAFISKEGTKNFK